MKRVGFLYDKMCDKSLIKKVILEGAKGKRKRDDVKEVLCDVDLYVDKIYELLTTNSYIPSIPRDIHIKDKSSGKDRIISVVPYYPDGIIHRVAVAAMQDILMRGMYYWSCASIPGRGNQRAKEYIERALQKDRRGTKYCAKMDIHHYYPSINKQFIMEALKRKIKDVRFLDLVWKIITSNNSEGLAIGFYINQWLANYLLEPIDHYICTLPGVKYYVRNMDDFVLLGPNKKNLHRAVRKIDEKLGGMNLHLKDNWQVFPVDSRGIDFVGYRFFHDKTILRRRNFLKFTRQCRKVSKWIQEKAPISFRSAAGLLSRVGQFKHCDGVKAKEKYFSPIGFKRLKSIVSVLSTRSQASAAEA